MWFKTLRLTIVLATISLSLGGCEMFRTYIYDPNSSANSEELAALEPEENLDRRPGQRAEKKKPRRSAAPKKVVPPAVMIAPVQGAPALSGRQMSARVANELVARKVQASFRSQGKTTYLLEGKAFLSASGGGKSDFRIDWNLIAPNGLSAGKFSDRVPVAGSGWGAVTAGVLDPMAQRAAAQIDILIQEHARAPSAAPVNEVASQELTDALQEIHVLRLLTPVFVGLVDGAPGDGKLSLKDALSKALLRARVPVTPSYSEDAFMVLGDVHVTPVDPTRNLFEITWIVMRSDGETIGTTASSMTVGVDRVTPAWGTVAVDAAEKVVGEIVALIDKAGNLNGGDQPES
ncbi:MAG: hypothetical protein HQ511_08130 [Rhodospirillales bacterium]|nr:hypothetical protein [Rhodospirillales bacterium]